MLQVWSMLLERKNWSLPAFALIAPLIELLKKNSFCREFVSVGNRCHKHVTDLESIEIPATEPHCLLKFLLIHGLLDLLGLMTKHETWSSGNFFLLEEIVYALTLVRHLVCLQHEETHPHTLLPSEHTPWAAAEQPGCQPETRRRPGCWQTPLVTPALLPHPYGWPAKVKGGVRVIRICHYWDLWWFWAWIIPNKIPICSCLTSSIKKGYRHRDSPGFCRRQRASHLFARDPRWWPWCQNPDAARPAGDEEANE